MAALIVTTFDEDGQRLLEIFLKVYNAHHASPVSHSSYQVEGLTITKIEGEEHWLRILGKIFTPSNDNSDSTNLHLPATTVVELVPYTKSADKV